MASGWELDEGGRPTFDELYRRCGARVYGYCRRLCDGNEVEAQDLAQETFVRAYRALDQFEGRSSVLTWLFQIARNERIRARSKDRGTTSLETMGAREQGHDPTPTQLRRLWVGAALQRLPDQLRDALILVKSEGLTYREAAEVLGIPQGTVQFHVHQAMKQMRSLLSEQVGLPLALALMLSLHLQRSAPAETVPPGLTERVYEAVGCPVPPPGPGAPPLPVSGPTRPAGPVPALALSGAAILVAGVFLAVPAWKALQPPPSPARARLAKTLASLAGVRTAHAHAALTMFQYTRRGEQSRQYGELDFWYQRPGRYQKSQLDRSGKLLARLVVDGKQAASRILRAKGDVILPHRVNPPVRMMGAFALFSPEGDLPRLQSSSQVANLAADGKPGEGELLSVLSVSARTRRRWLIQLESGSSLPVRVDYLSEQLETDGWRPSQHVVMETLEYDVPAPGSAFDLINGPDWSGRRLIPTP